MTVVYNIEGIWSVNNFLVLWLGFSQRDLSWPRKTAQCLFWATEKAENNRLHCIVTECKNDDKQSEQRQQKRACAAWAIFYIRFTAHQKRRMSNKCSPFLHYYDYYHYENLPSDWTWSESVLVGFFHYLVVDDQQIQAPEENDEQAPSKPDWQLSRQHGQKSLCLKPRMANLWLLNIKRPQRSPLGKGPKTAGMNLSNMALDPRLVAAVDVAPYVPHQEVLERSNDTDKKNLPETEPLWVAGIKAILENPMGDKKCQKVKNDLNMSAIFSSILLSSFLFC